MEPSSLGQLQSDQFEEQFVIIWDPYYFVPIFVLKHWGANLEVVHWAEMDKVVSFFCSPSICIGSNSTLEYWPIATYLGIYISHDDFDIIPQDCIHQVLQLLIEYVLIRIIMVICGCTALIVCHFGMGIINLALISHSLTGIHSKRIFLASLSSMKVTPWWWMLSFLLENRMDLFSDVESPDWGQWVSLSQSIVARSTI